MPTIDQIRESIDTRLSALSKEIAALESARATLEERATKAATGASANGSAHPSRRRARPRRSSGQPEVLPAGKLEAILRDAADGLSANAIANRSNAARRQVLELLRELERAGRARRNGTRWRLLSDEELIAERAAELERLSRNARR